jgi:hypothetical protein
VAGADGGDAWTWVSSSPAPFSGTLASQSTIAAGSHQHYFSGATATLGIATGDVLVAYVYLDPANVPSEIMLQWNDGSWEHRAYWGANNLTYGVDGTTSRRFMGALPAAGQWVRLEVPVSQVALEGSALKGMAFTLFDGRATWDAVGKASGSSGGSGGDSTPPVVAMTAPPNNSIVSGSSIAVSATASDDVGVAGVQFRIDGANLSAEGTTAPFSVVLNTRTVANGLHTLQAIARDAAGNHATSAIVNVLVTNAIASTSTNNDFVWVEDSVPNGAVPGADGGDAWTWVSSSPAPFSGTAAHQSNLSSASHQHYFSFAWTTLPVNTGDVLFAYVYLDPANPPQEIMLQWTNGSWEHRAYWGANLNTYGVDGSNSRRAMGALPAAGKWVRLEVPARSVGLEGSTVQGMAFTLWGGKATWDRAGKASSAGLILRKALTGMALTWSSAEGQSYRVLCRSNLLSGDWTDISGTITATNTVTTWTDTGTDAAPQRFYKISQ